MHFEPNQKYVHDQDIELQKMCFFEFKMYDFLIMSLNQIQRNMRNITALWAKDIGLNDIEKSA